MPGTPKQFNTHKWPDANHQPRQKAADRKMKAEVRQELANELTLEQKLAKLPPEPHCAKQRARYTAQLAEKNAKQATPEVTGALEKGELQVVAADTSPKQPKQKKYMKGSK